MYDLAMIDGVVGQSDQRRSGRLGSPDCGPESLEYRGPSWPCNTPSLRSFCPSQLFALAFSLSLPLPFSFFFSLSLGLPFARRCHMRVLIALDIALHRSRRHLRTTLERRDDLRLWCVSGWCFICRKANAAGSD